ncbi:hypothetical protein [Micromonospora coerulea]|uniref:hypothetical protein n=1 Tax=Micromonospora coerulea TaxID=47856 RepID=UPI0019060243|nr:hypothetical protein [Micromonospora veneta]
MFELSAHAIRGDQDEKRWRRIGRIVGQGFVSLNGPGRPPTSHQDGLRLSVAYEGHPAVTTARTVETAPELLPPNASSFTGYWQGGSVLGNTVHAQHRAWLWPTPPAGPIALTLQWNAMGIAPVTVELDITSLN